MHESAEEVIRLSDPACGLDGYMVLDDTRRGPATGGIRLCPYRSLEEALSDGRRLARAMTFKAAAADLPVGGGKIVAVRPPPELREACLRAIGRAIESMNGRFLAGRDVGVPVEDGALVRKETSYMVDESEAGVGDLNRATARGVVSGLRAALTFRWNRSDFHGVRIALQGAGGVGSWLARMLASEGAELKVAEPDGAALERLGSDVRFEPVAPEAIYDAHGDVFAPCAVGGVLDTVTVPRLAVSIVAGSANNVLRDEAAGRALFEGGITYAPDFLVNAGALIEGVEFLLHGRRDSAAAISAIGRKTLDLLVRSRDRHVPPEVLLEEDTRARLS